jgi:YVTN family beta-propeller protein
MSKMKLVCGLLALGAAAVVSCSNTTTTAPDQTVNEPFQGEAFPARPLGFTLPTGPYALVTNNGSDTVSVIDLTTHTRVGDVQVGLNPVNLDGPHHLAFNQANQEIFVALSYPAPAIAPGPHAAHGSSTTPGKVVRLKLPDFHLDAVEQAQNNPGDIVISDDGKRLVVSHFDLQKAVAQAANGVEAQRANLLVYDTATFGAKDAPDARSYPICVMPHGVSLSRPDGRFAYVACNGEDAVAVIDLGAPDPTSTIQRIPVGPGPGDASSPRYGPYATALSPDGTRVLLGDTQGHDLRIFDTQAGAMTDAVYSPGGAVYFPAIEASGTRIYVPIQAPDEISRVDLSGASPTEQALRVFTKDECQSPHEAALWNDDQELLLVCEGDHVSPGAVLVLDPTTLATKARIELGVYPDKVIVVKP